MCIRDRIRSMETCISDVKQWMMGDKLMLNDDKTEFIVIASRHLLKKIAINKSGWLKCLYCGIWACGLMTMAVYITKICSVTFYHLHNIRRIRKHLSMDSAATLIHSFISSQIEFY